MVKFVNTLSMILNIILLTLAVISACLMSTTLIKITFITLLIKIFIFTILKIFIKNT